MAAPRKIFSTLFGIAILAAGASAQTDPVQVTPGERPPAFTPEERASIQAYWNDPTRYTTTLPDDVLVRGAWQVRETVPGSQWLWNYQRGKKIPPTVNPVAVTDEQKNWEDWIDAKLRYDRWQALQLARAMNLKTIGKALPDPDATTPLEQPPAPGPIPPALLAWAGNPPALAEAVVPMQHTVAFEDASISYRDNTRLGNPRYAYYRFQQGVMSVGMPVKSLPSDKVTSLCQLAGIGDSDSKVMRAVSMLEGGFDSVNTYDTGYVSVGFIQFATLKGGANSVGQLLKLYKSTYPGDFQQDFRRFGIDVTPDGVLDVLDVSTGAELVGPDAARRVIDDKRLIAVFQRAGLRSDKYNATQLRAAKEIYYPANDAITVTVGDKTLTGTVADVIKTEAGMATLMDRKVNTGKLDPLPAILADVAAQTNPQSLSDLAAYERDIVDALRYRKDYLADATLSQPAASPVTRPYNKASRSGDRKGRGHKGR